MSADDSPIPLAAAGAAAGAGAELALRVAAAREALDARVREIVRWHFDPATGCPFWLQRAADLGFDPLEDIGGYSDLERFGLFQDEWLRGGPVRRWVPRAYAGERLYAFETGGSTGVPKSRINVRDFQVDYEQLSGRLPDEGFPPGSDWLMLGPSGPRRLRLAVEHLAQHRGGICFLVDLDPRWVATLVAEGRHAERERYQDHVIAQALTLLRAHDTIRCLFTTPKLLASLCRRIDLARAGIRGIFCGGTEISPEFHRFAREELVPGLDLVPTYGNTLMGLAIARRFDRAAGYDIVYHPPQPRAVIELVDPDDPRRTVGYGETGRVLLTTLTREFFMPRLLERDEAERAGPTLDDPWDGVQNVRLLAGLRESVAVGVY